MKDGYYIIPLIDGKLQFDYVDPEGYFNDFKELSREEIFAEYTYYFSENTYHYKDKQLTQSEYEKELENYFSQYDVIDFDYGICDFGFAYGGSKVTLEEVRDHLTLAMNQYLQ